MRTAEIKRKTGETDISLSLNLDGSGKGDRHLSGTGLQTGEKRHRQHPKGDQLGMDNGD